MPKTKSKQRSIRRRDRRRDGDQHVVLYPGPVAGPGVVVPTPEQILEALRSFRGDAPWEELAPDLLPMFERRRPMPPEVPPSLTVVLPPGVTVGFGIDLGPAAVRVSRPLLETWGIGVDELASTALDNLRSRAFAPGLPRLVREPIAGHPTIAFQSEDGWASALLLAPDALERVMGVEPRLFVAPMRDLLIGLPPDVDPELACWITEEFEVLDPNALALEGFLWQDGRLECRPIRPAAMSA